MAIGRVTPFLAVTVLIVTEDSPNRRPRAFQQNSDRRCKAEAICGPPVDAVYRHNILRGRQSGVSRSRKEFKKPQVLRRIATFLFPKRPTRSGSSPSLRLTFYWLILRDRRINPSDMAIPPFINHVEATMSGVLEHDHWRFRKV